VLELRELASTIVPTENDVLGARFESGGGILFWTANAVWRWSPPALPIKLCQYPIGSGEAWRSPLGGIVIVAALEASSLEVLEVGHSCRQRRVVLALPSAADWSLRANDARLVGAPLGDLWILSQSPRRAIAVELVNVNDGTSETVGVRGASMRISTLDAFLTSAWDSSLVLTERRYPFRSYLLGAGGQLRRVLAPYEHTSQSQRQELLAERILLSIHHLPPGYLQILADLASDRRTLVTFDSRGQMLRSREVTLAFGVADVDRNGRLVVFRDTGRNELVLYRWWWRRDS
jgi:hypothetical protein